MDQCVASLLYIWMVPGLDLSLNTNSPVLIACGIPQTVLQNSVVVGHIAFCPVSSSSLLKHANHPKFDTVLSNLLGIVRQTVNK
jgi:hypothetical protein